MKTPVRYLSLALMVCILMLLAVGAYAQVSGAIYTTLPTGTTVNANLYDAKTDVYLNGGPQNKNSAGLTPGTYYFQVTDPSGAVLLSTDNASCRQVTVNSYGVIAGAAGTPSSCVHPNGTMDPANGQTPVQLMPFNDTPNNGGEYKVWLIAQTGTTYIDGSDPRVLHFSNSDEKSDNFKVRKPGLAYLSVCKFNDLNGNGTQDTDEPFIAGWPMIASFSDGTTLTQTTDQDGCTSFVYTFSNSTSVDVTLTEGSEGDGWMQTAPLDGNGGVITSQSFTLTPDAKVNALNFGNRVVKMLAAPIPAKDANGSYKDTYSWQIQKAVDKTKVTQVGGSATFNYTVTVSHDGGTISNVMVTGTITVSNGNPVDIAVASVTDKLSDNTVCSVTGTMPITVPANSNVQLPYSCNLGALPQGALDNTVTITWNKQTIDGGDFLYVLDGGTDSATVSGISFTAALVDDNITVTDNYWGTLVTLGTVNVADANPTIFNYSRSIAVPQWNCSSYNNTATFTTDDTATTGSASQTVTVCGPIKTGALTMGFWQNKNGQGIISGGASVSGVCMSGTWLRQYAPFQDLSATATCRQVAGYVYNVVKAANAGGATMNAMLKAQMLATALDVYFSDPALGGNKIGAPTTIGSVVIDLTKIPGTNGQAPLAFGGATSGSIGWLLSYAAGQSNVAGSLWYGQVKYIQEMAKDTFDAINNQQVVGP